MFANKITFCIVFTKKIEIKWVLTFARLYNTNDKKKLYFTLLLHCLLNTCSIVSMYYNNSIVNMQLCSEYYILCYYFLI